MIHNLSAPLSSTRKGFVLTACLAAVLCFAVHQVASQVRPEVDELLAELASDYATPESVARLQRELRRPDIKLDLLAALRRDYFRQSPDVYKCGAALAALQHRADLSREELSIVTNELKRLASGNTGRTEHERQFVMVGLLVLKNYPTIEHENLTLRFAYDDLGWVLHAVSETLAAIGTQRSKPILESIREKLRKEQPESVILSDLDKAILSIEQRSAQLSR